MRISNLIKKCRDCRYNKNKVCELYKSPIKKVCITCSFDKRKVCELCKNWDKETEYCSVLVKNRYKDGKALRICNEFSSI